MDMQKIIEVGSLVLMIAGAVAVGLPALLRAVVLFLKAIPGEQGEAFLEEKVLPFSDKIADFVGKVYPGKKA